MSLKLVVSGLVLSASLVLGGCATAYKEDPEQCKAVKPGEIRSVNAMCVVMNEDPVDPAIEPIEFNGQKVGFCCPGCIRKWKGMNDAQKQTALDKAVAVSKK